MRHDLSDAGLDRVLRTRWVKFVDCRDSFDPKRDPALKKYNGTNPLLQAQVRLVRVCGIEIRTACGA